MRNFCAVTMTALCLACPAPAVSAELLTLGRAALMAVKNHPDIKVSQAALENQMAQEYIATDGYYPTVTGTSAYSYSEAQSAAAGGQNVIHTGFTRQYRLGISLNQTLMDFGKTRTAVEVQNKQVQAARYNVEGKIADILLNMGTQYFTVLRAQQDVRIFQDNVRNLEAQLGRAQGFYKAGTKAKIEVTQAEANLAAGQITLVKAINAEKKARANLNTCMGNQKFLDYTLQEIIVSAPKITLERALELAGDQRPDILAQRLSVRSSEAQVANGEAQYWPTISASGSYSWSDARFLPSPYNWSFGVTMSVPIFNEPLLSGQIRAYQAQLKQSQAQLESVILAGREAVVEAYISLHEAEQRVQLSLPALASAQENFRLATERYQVGVGASLDVSDAERLLVQARSQELQARFDLQLAIVKLHHEVGDLTLDLMLGAYPPGNLPGETRPPAPKPMIGPMPSL